MLSNRKFRQDLREHSKEFHADFADSEILFNWKFNLKIK